MYNIGNTNKIRNSQSLITRHVPKCRLLHLKDVFNRNNHAFKIIRRRSYIPQSGPLIASMKPLQGIFKLQFLLNDWIWLKLRETTICAIMMIMHVKLTSFVNAHQASSKYKWEKWRTPNITWTYRVNDNFEWNRYNDKIFLHNNLHDNSALLYFFYFYSLP